VTLKALSAETRFSLRVIQQLGACGEVAEHLYKSLLLLCVQAMALTEFLDGPNSCERGVFDLLWSNMLHPLYLSLKAHGD